jgi:hypothetical protein
MLKAFIIPTAPATRQPNTAKPTTVSGLELESILREGSVWVSVFIGTYSYPLIALSSAFIYFQSSLLSEPAFRGDKPNWRCRIFQLLVTSAESL